MSSMIRQLLGYGHVYKLLIKCITYKIPENFFFKPMVSVTDREYKVQSHEPVNSGTNSSSYQIKKL